ncbi:MAG: DNA primase [Epsilonproteobacteria bacterium]|nr:DNA primase [Campylobacterota bacterium]NPA57241.1 DNA primase [Campylobacterota bacterium]
MIDRNSIERLKTAIDIVDVIGHYIELKKAGSNYKGLCPFHDEKTPSFVVSPSRQIFHCFGCGVGGDAIKFVMEYEKISYPEAIEKLASLYNIPLIYTSQKGGGSSSLFKALEEINRLYKRTLPQKREAMDYLRFRGVSSASIERFELGYAPESFLQIDHLKSHFIPLRDGLKAGILGERGGKLYARLVERITFPIYSPSGKIVGFGGRTMTDHVAKYLNTPQTELFNKSRLLYGYHLAKEQIYKKRRLILSEGYLDVVMLHQAGFNTAVATLGTALTPSHLPLIRRGEPQVILAYDGDRAGIQAALKAAQLLARSGIEGGVVLFTDGDDPADMVQKGRIEELERLFSHPKPLIEFVLESIVQSFDLTNPREKEKALLQGVEFLKTLSPILREEYRDYLAALLGTLPSRIPLTSEPLKGGKSLEVRDTKELSLIKTMLLYPETVERVVDTIGIDHIRYHKREFEAALEGRREDPALRAILLDEEIIPFRPEELEGELVTFLIKYYERKLKEIAKKDIPFEEKSFFIRKYRENILKLRRGELAIE